MYIYAYFYVTRVYILAYFQVTSASICLFDNLICICQLFCSMIEKICVDARVCNAPLCVCVTFVCVCVYLTFDSHDSDHLPRP